MQDTVTDLAGHAAIAAQTSSHNASWAAVSVIGGSGTVATAAVAPATSDFWVHLTHASIVFGFALCLTGLVRFYWDAKERFYKAKIGSGE